MFSEFSGFNRYIIYVTGYWKTDRNVTLGLFHFIGPADSHTHSLPMHCALIGLADWSAFLELVCEIMTETMGPMEGFIWEVWSDIHP